MATLMNEIEVKKSLIRNAASVEQAKECMIDMGKNLAVFLMKELRVCLPQSKSESNFGDTDVESELHELDAKARTLLVAYSYLIDQDNANKINSNKKFNATSVSIYLSYNLTPYEISIVNLLKNTYVVQPDGCDSFQQASKKLKLSTDNNFGQQSYPAIKSDQYDCSSYAYNYQPASYSAYQDNFNYTDTFNYSGVTNNGAKVTQINDASSLKVLHFVLLLFSSFLTLDKFLNSSKSCTTITAASTTTTTTTSNATCGSDFTATSCQKLILQLLDATCQDQIVKTKILLSISELDLI